MEQWNGFKGKLGKKKLTYATSSKKTTHLMTEQTNLLAGPTEATTKLWDQVMDLNKQERDAGGVLDMDTKSRFNDYFSRPGLFEQRVRNSCRFPNRKTFQTQLATVRRYPNVRTISRILWV